MSGSQHPGETFKAKCVAKKPVGPHIESLFSTHDESLIKVSTSEEQSEYFTVGKDYLVLFTPVND